jgi:two-component system NtrC family sensor kinase
MASRPVRDEALDLLKGKKGELEILRLYERAMSATSCGIVIADATVPNNPLLYCNPAFESITGYSQVEVLGRNCKFLQGVDTDPEELDKLRQAIRGGQECEVTLKNYRKDGTPFWNDLKLSPVHDADGKLTHFVGIQTDITQRKLAEDKRRLMQFSIDCTADAAFWITPDGRFFYVNEAACKLLGYSREELLRLSVGDIDPELSLQAWVSNWQQSKEKGSGTVETEYRSRDGQVIPVEVTFNYLEFDDKEYNCAFARDISDRQRTQAALQRSNALLKAQHEAALDGILVLDETGAVASYNYRFCEMWDIPSEIVSERRDESLLNYILPRLLQPQEFLEKVTYLYDHPTISSRDEIHLRDGQVFDRYSAPVLSPEKEYYGRIWSFRDITERKYTEEALRQQVQRERLVEMISRRIRQSLNLEEVLNTAVAEVRQFLHTDRAVIYRFEPDWSGVVAVESVSWGWTSALGTNIQDNCFQDTHGLLYQQGRIRVINDIYNASLTPCHVELLERFQVRANLVVPILLGEKLWGLLIVHQCSGIRHWQNSEVELLKQLSAQLGVAIQRAALFEQLAAELAERKAAEAALRQSQARLLEQRAQLESTLHELKQTQVQLIQTEKMSSLGQLVAGIAHEINNPVSFICGNISHASTYAQDLLDLMQLYQKYYPQPVAEIQSQAEAIDCEFLIEDFPRLLNSMKVGTDRIRQIVLSLRSFSRLDEAERKPVDIHQGIDNTLMILQHRLRPEAGGVQLIKEYGNLPKVECFAGQLNQVFMNLLNNAVDALEEESEELGSQNSKLSSQSSIPTIWIRTEVVSSSETADKVVIRIADNGSGIPEAVKQQIFDPFFTTKPVGSGTGLGLTISYQIIEKHGGQLRCNSEMGQGTEFVVEIPLQELDENLGRSLTSAVGDREPLTYAATENAVPEDGINLYKNGLSEVGDSKTVSSGLTPHPTV